MDTIKTNNTCVNKPWTNITERAVNRSKTKEPPLHEPTGQPSVYIFKKMENMDLYISENTIFVM